MKGIKVAGVFAGLGFLLSFISGLFSHKSILSILLEALLFCLIFGALGFLISFIFNKFLDDGSSSGFSGDTDISSSASTEGSSSSGGHLVDITIQDEDLETSESGNHFVVGENHQMLNSSDVKNNSSIEPLDTADNGFVPVRKAETVNNISGKESVSEKELQSSPENSLSPSSNDVNGGIDTLPDMNNLEFGESNSSSSSDSDNSGFETESEPVATSQKRNSNEVPEIKDAALMAKAISSVLSDENSL